MLQQLSQAVAGGHYKAPKTLLGFLGVVVLIGASLSLGLAITFIGTDYQWLIIPVLLGFAVGTALLVRSVLKLAQQDPTPLVLGEMTGEDWIAHRRLVMGDSQRGDRIEAPVSLIEQPAPVEQQQAELPNGEDGK